MIIFCTPDVCIRTCVTRLAHMHKAHAIPVHVHTSCNICICTYVSLCVHVSLCVCPGVSVTLCTCGRVLLCTGVCTCINVFTLCIHVCYFEILNYVCATHDVYSCN